jgi:hypothetical protein
VKKGVAVGDGDGVTVSVGVRVGGPGVKASVGSCNAGCEVCDKASWTNPAMTVSATAVLTALKSGVATAGATQARIAIDRIRSAEDTRVMWDIVPPNKLLVQLCEESPTSFPVGQVQ